jgi:hypothetical protein
MRSNVSLVTAARSAEQCRCIHDDNDHSFVVLRPDEHGVYRAIDVEGSVEIARERLFAAMTQLEQRPGSPPASSL